MLLEPLTKYAPRSRLGAGRIFISVDLPAPFSPTMAALVVTGITVRLTPSFATTPGKRFTMSRSSVAAVCPPGWSLTF